MRRDGLPRRSIRANVGFVGLLESVGAGILMLMVFLTTAEAVGRTFFGFSLRLTYELVAALTGCLGFVGLAATFRKGYHIRVMILLSRLPANALRRLDAGAHVVAGIYGLVLLYLTFNLASDSIRVGETSTAVIQFPLYPFKVLLPIGLLAFLFVLAGQLRAMLRTPLDTSSVKMQPADIEVGLKKD